MRFSLKVIGLLWVGLFLIIGVLLYNAYSKLKPETFITIISEQVQRNIPGAELEVGQVSYGFSLDFNLNLRNLHLRRGEKLLGSIGEVEVKVPWWLLLSNKGNAQINLTNLDIFIDHTVIAKKASEQGVGTEKVEIKVDLPSYLSNARFTVRAKEVSIRDLNNARRYFMISKLLVREFKYGKNSAFELNIPISIKHKEVQYASELWLFGDVTPDLKAWKLNYRGEFRTKDTTDKFQIEDLVLNGQSTFMPGALSVQSDLSLLVEKEVIGKGQFRAGKDDLAVNMQFSKLPLNYFSFIYEDIKNPYLKVLEGSASGSIKFRKEFQDSSATVQGKLTFDGNLSLSDTYFIPGKWKIGFQDSRWDTSFLSPKGEASFFRRSTTDVKNNTVVQYTDELGFSNQDVTQILPAVKPLSTFTGPLPPIYYTSNISFNKCVLGDRSFNGNVRYGHSPDLKFYQANLKVEDSDLRFSYAEKRLQKTLELELKKFNFNSSYHFFDPYFSASEGQLTGTVEGQWSEAWDAGTWKVDVSGEQLSELRGLIPDLISKTAALYELDSSLAKQIELKFTGNNHQLTITSLMLQMAESVRIAGSLNSKEKSSLVLSYPKNKKFKPLKKEVTEPYWIQKDAQ